jgi:hypothetical protein
MIESTFLHLPRLGPTGERRIWEAGIRTWQSFLDAPAVPRLSPDRKRLADGILVESRRALAAGDSAFFTSLPRAQQWRLYPAFADEAVFVDIETSWRGDVTVLGIYDGRTVKQFIRGVNLTPQAIREHLQGKLIVTYNGASFDLPVIERCFPGTVPSVPHFDTMHLARALGYRGGLKALEVSLGIRRPDAVAGMSGSDALYLWDRYRASGEEEHLQTLLAYNAEDIVNLVTVARALTREATDTVWSALPSPAGPPR